MSDWSNWHRILVYGGTFDPPHRAHVQLPGIVARHIGADGVLYIPAGRPPHKPDLNRTDGAHRLAMLRLALADCRNTAIWDYELKQSAPSYTVHTLQALRELVPKDTQLRLLMGMDMALIFDKWREPGRIEALAQPLVMVRPPDDCATFLGKLDASVRQRWADRVVAVEPMDVSSRSLREAMAQHGLGDAHVMKNLAPAVRGYILEHGLYGVR